MQTREPKKRRFIAHRRESDGAEQDLADHLRQVGQLAARNAAKLRSRPSAHAAHKNQPDLRPAGELLGLLHDFGKYSKEFQDYLASAVGLLDQDADDYVDATKLRGRIDHSTAGAQLIWGTLSKHPGLGPLVAQILALCISSHHSGLIDCLAPDGNEVFNRRMQKETTKTHLDEALAAADIDILQRAREIMNAPGLVEGLHATLQQVLSTASGRKSHIVSQQHLGLLVRLLFSCLIDADRIDTADFERPHGKRHRSGGRQADWATLADRLERHLAAFVEKDPIDRLRAEISRRCLDHASAPSGTLRTLTVPTGGGKTFASLRFALHHAKRYRMERVLYVIPFTSIIDQNAEIVRGILEPSTAGESPVVLEHHSNLTPEHQSWREKLLSENWDAPVVFTTMVQFLDTLFGAGTRGARRMHQLANAVIVFDEIQTLPIYCVHLFCNAVSFLVRNCNTTVVLCTATQPLLDRVDSEKGSLGDLAAEEIMPDVKRLFTSLARVEVRNQRRPGGWTDEEIAILALEETTRTGSCLVVVNTKTAAQRIYRLCKRLGHVPVAHLSTNLCPAHRKHILELLRQRLNCEKPIACVSTQLIEAGVDIDFGAVIRFSAGLDSIAQAAGRCNRHGRRPVGTVHVVNPRDERIDALADIRKGRDSADRVLDDYEVDPDKFGQDPIGPEAMGWYYENYFFAQAGLMDYPVGPEKAGRDDTLLNMLSGNSNATAEFHARHPERAMPHLRHSFMSAAKLFAAIDAPTRGVVVPYGNEGRQVVADLCSEFAVEKQGALFRRAQQYTVNVFPNVLTELDAVGALHPVQRETEILHVDPRFYSSEIGLTTTPVEPMEALIL